MAATSRGWVITCVTLSLKKVVVVVLLPPCNKASLSCAKRQSESIIIIKKGHKSVMHDIGNNSWMESRVKIAPQSASRWTLTQRSL